MSSPTLVSQYLNGQENAVSLPALLKPYVADRKQLQEFSESFFDQIPNIERDIAHLREHPEDKNAIANLFRALHNIKGDAAICQVDVGTIVAHLLETILARLRAGEIAFSSELAELLLLILDRLEQAIDALVAKRSLEHLGLVELVSGLHIFGLLKPEQFDEKALQLIETVTGFRPRHLVKTVVKPSLVACARTQEQMAADLQFFRSLALQLDSRFPMFNGRTERLLRLALETNQVAGNLVDPLQLEAAVYMHDIGMMFVAEHVWLKIEKLSVEDYAQVQEHSVHAGGLLERMEGWAEAARMVVQHHETLDGRGYPQGLKDAAICNGAKILAIIDAFEAGTLLYQERGQTRAMLKAIVEVNASDKQFSAPWVAAFNRVVRNMLEAAGQ